MYLCHFVQKFHLVLKMHPVNRGSLPPPLWIHHWEGEIGPISAEGGKIAIRRWAGMDAPELTLSVSDDNGLCGIFDLLCNVVEQ